MHGFENNLQLLKQWAEIHPQLPLPSDWKQFQEQHLNAALQTMNQAPWIVQLLDGSAPAALKVAALEGKLPTQADYARHLQQQAQAQRTAEEEALKKLSEQADAAGRARLGDRRFEAEQAAQAQHEQRLQMQQQQTAEFEQRMARRAV